VPFASDSELWPYTQGPVQENSHSDPDEDGDDGDIVELNFEETSVLSDPEAFKKALQRKKSGLKAAEVPVNGHRNVNGVSGEKEKGRRNRKNKKERREIEERWDIPPPSFVDPVASTSFNMLPVGPPASPSLVSPCSMFVHRYHLATANPTYSCICMYSLSGVIPQHFFWRIAVTAAGAIDGRQTYCLHIPRIPNGVTQSRLFFFCFMAKNFLSQFYLASPIIS
jgi:hypothetical protein